MAKNRKKNSNEWRGVNVDESAMCYINISMDFTRQVLQTKGKLFFLIRIRFRINGRKPENVQTISEA